MVFVQRSKNENTPPNEIFTIGKNLSVAIWVATNASGTKRWHWKASRVNSEGQYFSLMLPSTLLDFPRLVAVLAAGFSSLQSLDSELRQNLKTLENLMTEADARLRLNGELREKTDADERYFKR